MTETPTTRPRLHIGLTGGIASGKSTVAAELAGLGAIVVDADALARAVVACYAQASAHPAAATNTIAIS